MRLSTLSAFREAFLLVAAIFRDRFLGRDASGEEARDCLSGNGSSESWSETGLGEFRSCGLIRSDVRSGQLRELLGDFGASRIPVVFDRGAAVGRTSWRGWIGIRWTPDPSSLGGVNNAGRLIAAANLRATQIPVGRGGVRRREQRQVRVAVVEMQARP